MDAPQPIGIGNRTGNIVRGMITLFLAAGFISGCGSAAPSPQGALENPPETADSAPTRTPLEAASQTVSEEVDHCVVCHSDEQALIDTVSPEEPLHVASSGEG